MNDIDIFWLRYKVYEYIKSHMDIDNEEKSYCDGIDLVLTALSSSTGIDWFHHFGK